MIRRDIGKIAIISFLLLLLLLVLLVLLEGVLPLAIGEIGQWLQSMLRWGVRMRRVSTFE
jgi:hypothetical protein